MTNTPPRLVDPSSRERPTRTPDDNRRSAQVWMRAVSYTARIAVLGLTVGVAWSTFHGVSLLFSERPVPSASGSVDALPRAPMHHLQSLPYEGFWTFADAPWEIGRKAILADGEDARRAALLAFGAEVPVATDRSARAIFDSLRNASVEVYEEGGARLYSIGDGPLRLSFVSRVSGGVEGLAAAMVEVSGDRDDSSLLYLRPGNDVGRGPAADPILPLPSGSTRAMARWSDDGRLLLELIVLPGQGTPSDLLRSWRNAGWEVRSGSFGGPAGRVYLCSRGNEVVSCWFKDPPRGGPAGTILLITRVEAEAETGKPLATPHP